MRFVLLVLIVIVLLSAVLVPMVPAQNEEELPESRDNYICRAISIGENRRIRAGPGLGFSIVIEWLFDTGEWLEVSARFQPRSGGLTWYEFVNSRLRVVGYARQDVVMVEDNNGVNEDSENADEIQCPAPGERTQLVLFSDDPDWDCSVTAQPGSAVVIAEADPIGRGNIVGHLRNGQYLGVVRREGVAYWVRDLRSREFVITFTDPVEFVGC